MSKNQNKFPQIANTAENTVQGWLKTYQSFLMHFHSQITHQQHWKTAPEKHNTHKPTFLHVPDASSKMGSFLDFLLVSKLTKRLLVYSLHYFSSQTEKIAKKKKKLRRKGPRRFSLDFLTSRLQNNSKLLKFPGFLISPLRCSLFDVSMASDPVLQIPTSFIIVFII